MPATRATEWSWHNVDLRSALGNHVDIYVRCCDCLKHACGNTNPAVNALADQADDRLAVFDFDLAQFLQVLYQPGGIARWVQSNGDTCLRGRDQVGCARMQLEGLKQPAEKTVRHQHPR